MSEFYVWPRMDNSAAEKRFQELSQTNGPKVSVEVKSFDFSGVGTRLDPQKLRDQFLEVAKPLGFNHRQGYDQAVTLQSNEQGRQFDRAFAAVMTEIMPMRWAEAGSREVWSWLALALLPDLTHWRWRSLGAGDGSQWHRPRWVGGDMSRHTWARYWWRGIQFEQDRGLLNQLQEHDLNHLLERADTIGANRPLLTAFARQLLELEQEFVNGGDSRVTRRTVFDDSARRMLRRMAYVDIAALTDEEVEALVDGFVTQTRLILDSMNSRAAGKE